jgi:hypothetical protein
MEISYENFIALTHVQKDKNVNPTRTFPLSFPTLKVSRHEKKTSQKVNSHNEIAKMFRGVFVLQSRQIRAQRFSLS